MGKPFGHETGKGIKSVTLMPAVLLRLQGVCDARKQVKAVPEKRIEGLVHSCAEIEKGEALVTARQLKKPREAGAAALVTIKQCREKIKENSDFVPEDSPAQIRENMKRREIVSAAKLEIRNAEKTLVEVSRKLINEDIILNERIEKTRDKARRGKISAYERGVRKRIPDFSYTASFSNDAYDTYYSKNEATDNAIISYAAKISEGVE